MFHKEKKLRGLPIEFLKTTGHKPGEVIGKIIQSPVLENARRAAEAHRRVRYHLQDLLQPGMSLKNICDIVENSTTTLLKGELNDGLGFPTGLSLNSCAAHYSVNPGDEDIFLKETDLLKVDYGTHVDGIIMDSAFTVTWDPNMKNLIDASKEATERGIKMIGVDVCVSEIGREISEVMSGYEVTINDKKVPVKPVANLNGHSIKPYKIHGGVSIPLVENDDSMRLAADCFYALETFASTGKGFVKDGPNCSHFMLLNPNRFKVTNPKNVKVLQIIKKHIKTLPFSARFIDRLYDFPTSSLISLKNLAMLGLLEPYPPLYDVQGSFVSQFEHTVYLNEETKEILTRGDDY